MNDGIIALVLVLMFIDLMLSIFVFAVNFGNGDYYAGCPFQLYRNSKLNFFGVMLEFLLLFCIAPLYYLLWGAYWLLHVGRKEK